MATSTRTGRVCHPPAGRPPPGGPRAARQARQALDRGRGGRQRLVDVGLGRRVAQGEPDGAPGVGGGDPHGQQDVARLDRTARAGRTGRGADQGLVQQHQQLLLLDAGEPQVAWPGSTLAAGGALGRPRDRRQQPVGQPVAQAGHPCRTPLARCATASRSATASPTAPATSWVPLRRSRSWPPPNVSGRSRVPSRTTRTPDPLRAPELVRADRDQVGARRRRGHVEKWRRLHGVGVQRRPRAPAPARCG